VLGRFGRRFREARAAYEAFVASIRNDGRREELTGGGLRRSVAFLGRTEQPESYDARVFGSGEFVDRLREEETLRERIAPALSVAELVERVAEAYGLEPERVLARSTKRGVVSYLAMQWLGTRGTEVGRVLGFTDSGAGRSVASGRAILAAEPGFGASVAWQ
jgi:hypothetical protein